MKKFYVYIHTCPNGKKYVGLTTTEPKKRWGSNGIKYKSNKHFYSAIQKYGWNNIDHRVFEVDTLKEMDYLEKYLIAFYNTIDPLYGYNISQGGDHTVLGLHWRVINRKGSPNKGKPMSDEQKKKISNSLKGFHHSEETKAKMKGRIPWNKGISTSDEVKMKMSNKMKGRKRIYNEDGTYHY